MKDANELIHGYWEELKLEGEPHASPIRLPLVDLIATKLASLVLEEPKELKDVKQSTGSLIQNKQKNWVGRELGQKKQKNIGKENQAEISRFMKTCSSRHLEGMPLTTNLTAKINNNSHQGNIKQNRELLDLDAVESVGTTSPETSSSKLETATQVYLKLKGHTFRRNSRKSTHNSSGNEDSREEFQQNSRKSPKNQKFHFLFESAFRGSESPKRMKCSGFKPKSNLGMVYEKKNLISGTNIDNLFQSSTDRRISRIGGGESPVAAGKSTFVMESANFDFSFRLIEDSQQASPRSKNRQYEAEEAEILTSRDKPSSQEGPKTKISTSQNEALQVSFNQIEATPELVDHIEKCDRQNKDQNLSDWYKKSPKKSKMFKEKNLKFSQSVINKPKRKPQQGAFRNSLEPSEPQIKNFRKSKLFSSSFSSKLTSPNKLNKTRLSCIQSIDWKNKKLSSRIRSNFRSQNFTKNSKKMSKSTQKLRKGGKALKGSKGSVEQGRGLKKNKSSLKHISAYNLEKMLNREVETDLFEKMFLSVQEENNDRSGSGEAAKPTKATKTKQLMSPKREIEGDRLELEENQRERKFELRAVEKKEKEPIHGVLGINPSKQPHNSRTTAQIHPENLEPKIDFSSLGELHHSIEEDKGGLMLTRRVSRSTRGVFKSLKGLHSPEPTSLAKYGSKTILERPEQSTKGHSKMLSAVASLQRIRDFLKQTNSPDSSKKLNLRGKGKLATQKTYAKLHSTKRMGSPQPKILTANASKKEVGGLWNAKIMKKKQNLSSKKRRKCRSNTLFQKVEGKQRVLKQRKK